MKKYEVIEDSGEGLTLVIFDKKGAVEYIHTGYEYTPGQLIRNIEELKEDESVEDWDGGEENPQETYENITSFECGWEIVADNNGIYPSKMGRAARLEFNISQ